MRKSMKKRWAALLLAGMMALSAGCGKKEKKSEGTEAVSAEPITEKVTEEETEKPTETETETETEATEATEAPSAEEHIIPITPAELWSFLSGDSWDFLPYGYSEGGDDYYHLSFDWNNTTFRITRDSDDCYAAGIASISSRNTDMGAGDLMTWYVTDISEGFAPNAGSILDSSVDFQIIAGKMNGQDVLALRQMGNEDAELVYNSFLQDTTCWDGFWVFSRYTDAWLSDFQMEGYRKKDTHFTAFLWLDYGDQKLLQEVETLVTEEDWNGEMVSSADYCLPMGEDALQIVSYWVKDGAAFSYSGSFMPGLAEVTVDENGEITDFVPLEYLGYGCYRNLE